MPISLVPTRRRILRAAVFGALVLASLTTAVTAHAPAGTHQVAAAGSPRAQAGPTGVFGWD